MQCFLLMVLMIDMMEIHNDILHSIRKSQKSQTSQSSRALILIRKKSNNRMHVLVSEMTAAHLPVCQINPMRSIHSTLKKYLTEIFGAEIPAHKVFIIITEDIYQLHVMLSTEHIIIIIITEGIYQLHEMLSTEHIIIIITEDIYQLHGMLSLEHSGRPANSNDGCCLSLLISVKVSLYDDDDDHDDYPLPRLIG